MVTKDECGLEGKSIDCTTRADDHTMGFLVTQLPWKQLGGYRCWALFPLLLAAIIQTSSPLILYPNLHQLAWDHILFALHTHGGLITMAMAAAGLTYLICHLLFTPGPTLLLDFACFKPDDSTKITKPMYTIKAKKSGFFTEKSLEFQQKILAISGLGDETYVPPSTLCEPVDRSLKTCHMEAQIVIFGVLDELFSKGSVKPKDVDILVVNCSLYSPVPSLSAMIVNHYKMRSDIEVFNLGGMGCSAGLIAVDLARKIMSLRRNGAYAAVVSTEVISAHLGYPGNDRSMMVGLCIFRWGASGLILSNRRGKLIIAHSADHLESLSLADVSFPRWTQSMPIVICRTCKLLPLQHGHLSVR
jgi:3-ketoacyl-CoA synthase